MENESTLVSLRSCFAKSFPLHAGGLLLRIPEVEEVLAFNCQTAQEESLSRFTCRPVASHTPQEQRERLQGHLRNPDVVFAGIFLPKDSSAGMIGKINFFDYNPRNRSAEFGYRILKAYRRCGYTSTAVRALLQISFTAAKLHKVYAQTGSFNRPSVALLKSLGFSQDAVLRDHHELDGKFYDDLIFSILETEWNI